MHARLRRAAGSAALALTVLAFGAATASASPVTATIRVEGLTGTVIPTTTLATDARPVVSADNVAHQLGAPSALTLLADAAGANGLPLSCAWSTVYSDCLVNAIGPAFPAGATDYWRLVVNGKDAQVGFAGTALHPGDRVDVIATDYTALSEPPLLTIATPAAPLTAGTPFTVTVTSLDTSGFGTIGPGAGAVVAYGDQKVTAAGNGTATFAATGAGYGSISATLAGATSSQVTSFCSYTTDPTICLLPAPAVPVSPAAVAATTPAASVAAASTASADRIAPSSRFTLSFSLSKAKNVKRLVGVTAPDRSDIASVSYALAKRVGTLCRFRKADGTLAAATSCAKAIWLPATGRAYWHVTFTKALAAGRWRAFSRATDGAGNVEASFESQTSFIVTS